MDPTDFGQLRDEFYRLYRQGEYVRARNLIETHAYNHPDRASALYNWRICMAARCNDAERAVALFQEALEQGYWWPESALREDVDLGNLQGRSDFENLVMISAGRFAQAQASSKAEMLIFLPDIAAARPYPLMIALHGRCGNALDASSHWRCLTDMGWIVVSPQSSQVIGKDSYCWDDLEKARIEIRDHYIMLNKDYPIDPRRVVLGGFSQGGGIAIRLAINGVIPVRGFVVVTPYLEEIDSLLPPAGVKPPPDLRGYLVTGAQDADQEPIQQVEMLLHKQRLPHQRENHPNLSHAFPESFDRSLVAAFTFFFQE